MVRVTIRFARAQILIMSLVGSEWNWEMSTYIPEKVYFPWGYHYEKMCVSYNFIDWFFSILNHIRFISVIIF